MRTKDKPILTALAASVKEGVILEVGALKGEAAKAMAEVSSVPVYSIDMWDLTFKGDTRPKRHRKVENLKEYERNTEGLDCVGIKGLSTEIAKVWSEPIGMLFIDGDHSYEGCKGDYEAFASHVIPGGLIVFHDYNEACPGVQKVVEGVGCDYRLEDTTAIFRRDPCKRSIA